jgi:hypothetical protein
MKYSKEARVFRRAQAVREVVAGQTVKAVSNTFHFTNSALRKWVQRFAQEGTGGLFDRPRSGRRQRYRSWSRITSGVLLDVIGVVQYGTSRVFYKIVPHFDANEFRQYIHQVMHTFGATKKKVVMVVDRSGIHRARKLAPTLDHDKDKFELHFLPAHSGHHLNPIEGF